MKLNKFLWFLELVFFSGSVAMEKKKEDPMAISYITGGGNKLTIEEFKKIAKDQNESLNLTSNENLFSLSENVHDFLQKSDFQGNENALSVAQFVKMLKQQNMTTHFKCEKRKIIKKEHHYQCKCTWAGCGKLFRYPSFLKTHLRSHTQERSFVCTKCGAGFTQLSSLKVHRYIHEGKTPFTCRFCAVKFSTSRSCVRHEKNCPKKCTICEDVNATVASL